jgi:hypothetical protein
MEVFDSLCKFIENTPVNAYSPVVRRTIACLDQVVPTYKPPIVWLWGLPGCGKSLAADGLAKCFTSPDYAGAQIRAWDAFYDAIMDNAQTGKSGHNIFSTLIVDEMGKDEQSHFNEVKMIHILGDSKVWTPDCKISKNQGRTVKIGLVIITSNIPPNIRAGFNDGSVLRRLFIVKCKFGKGEPSYETVDGTVSYYNLLRSVSNLINHSAKCSRRLSRCLQPPPLPVVEIDTDPLEDDEPLF